MAPSRFIFRAPIPGRIRSRTGCPRHPDACSISFRAPMRRRKQRSTSCPTHTRGRCRDARMFTTLMKTRRFAPLFWCQLFSAFNDNFLKNSLVFLILFKLSGPSADSLITLAGAVLMFPFFILSAIGGEIADRYDKAYVAERLKRIEIAVAALAVAGFWLHSI